MIEKMNPARRTFIKSLVASSAMVTTQGFASPSGKAALPATLTVVFQGDSITDYGRNKESTGANDTGKMGAGYALLSTATLMGEYPSTAWKCYNRGISGNKVYQLAERWDADCLSLQPDVISILIGVNDYWHTFKHGYTGTVKTYEEDLRRLMDRTLKARPQVKFILGEPFTVKGGSALSEGDWNAPFDAYRVAAKKVSDDYKTGWVPYQRVFDEALNQAPTTYWSWDGIHPSFAGCYIMAKAWNESFNALFT